MSIDEAFVEVEARAREREQALLVAGAIGGPFTIAVYTPLRNAITLGSKDATVGAAALYARCFARGAAGGWTGWLAPTVFSCPQFLAMGPLYHAYAEALGGASAAIIPTAMTESLISFGSQARNAQLAYNASRPAGAPAVALQQPWDPRGAGFAPHVARNACAMSGIRVLSGPVSAAIDVTCRALGFDADARARAIAADFASSVLAAAISMPFNQIFNYLATTPRDARAEASVLRSCVAFLRSQYLVACPKTGGLRLSRTVLRDGFMRCMYIAPQLSTFSAIERLCLLKVADGG